MHQVKEHSKAIRLGMELTVREGPGHRRMRACLEKKFFAPCVE